MDELSKIIERVTLSIEIFYTGSLCGIQSLGGGEGGHLHVLESGKLTVVTAEGHKICLDTPSVIFIPNGTEHKIISSESDNANLICALVKYNSSNSKMLMAELPQFIYQELTIDNETGKTAQWLFSEAFGEKIGRQAIIDKLADIFLLQVLRHVVDSGVILQGVLSAMTHERLAPVIEAIHSEPERQWTVEDLADIAYLSRSKFAALFKETVGQSPNNYLTEVRICKAQSLLKKGKSVSLIANEVGYEHGSALARVFRKALGVSPKEWLIEHNEERL